MTQALQSKCVLLVDDDATARYGMRRALEGRYKVLESESAASARTLLRAENPGLLLLDIEMPGENGLDFLREVKGQENSPAVVMITAYGSEKLAVEAMKSGAYDYLPKPFEVDDCGWWLRRCSNTWTWRRKTADCAGNRFRKASSAP